MIHIRYIISKVIGDYEIFCDMDGVLADFVGSAKKVFPKFHDKMDDKEKSILWRRIESHGPRFWRNIRWTEGGKELWTFISQYGPRILSAYPKNGIFATVGKRIWLSENIGDNLADEAVFCRGKDKPDHAHPRAILIDDDEKNIKAWEEKGGIGILYTSAPQTIKKLKAIFNADKKPM